MIIKHEDIAKARAQAAYGFGNQILYDMCKNYPKHIDEAVIIGKIWLIGRSYAAAIERGSKRINYETDVGPAIKAIGDTLDDKISHLAIYPQITRECLSDMLKTHHFLMKEFRNITGMDKRSLASKYLHFHAPNVVYIYDSLAQMHVSKYKLPYRPLKMELQKELGANNVDDAYLDFVAKAFELNEQIHREHNIWLTPRELDAVLLNY